MCDDGKEHLLTKLQQLFVGKEDLISSGRISICLTATSILFLNKCFSDTQYYPDSCHDSVQLLKESVASIHTLKIVAGPFKSQFVFDISCFQRLQVLEISKIPIGLIAGLQSLRAQIRCLITSCSIDKIKDVLALCDYGQTTEFAWPQLEQLDFSSNNLRKLDTSMRLLTSLKFLNLSHNNFTAAIEENWRHLPEITWLNIGCNQLTKIPCFPEICRGKITTLILINNDLDDLEGLETLSNLQVLDVSVNSITCFSAFRSLACLQKMIVFNCFDNPVAYHKDFRQTVISVFSPCLRKNPIVFDGRALTGREMCIIGSSVEVDLSSFIPYGSPTSNIQHHFGTEVVFQQSADHSTPSRTPERKKRVIRQPSILNAGEEDGKKSAVFVGNILESSEEIERLEKFKKQVGEDYLVVRNLQEVENNKKLETDGFTAEIETFPAQPEKSPEYFESPPLSPAELGAIQDGCILVSASSTPITDEEEPHLETLFVTVKENCILEYDSCLKNKRTLHLDCLLDVKVVPMENHYSVQLRFGYVNEKKRFRQYIMVDKEGQRSEDFISTVKQFVRQLSDENKKPRENQIKCLKCSTVMNSGDKEITNCSNCDSTMLFDVTPTENAHMTKTPHEGHPPGNLASLPHPGVIPKEVYHSKVPPDVCADPHEQDELSTEYGELVSSIKIKSKDNEDSFSGDSPSKPQSAAVDIQQSGNKSSFNRLRDYSTSLKESFIASSSEYYDSRLSTSTRSSVSSQTSTPITGSRFQKMSFTMDSCTHCDHRLMLHFETKMFNEEGETFCCMIKCPIVSYGDSKSTMSLLVISNIFVYICKITGFESVQPEEWLSLNASFLHADLRHIEYGLQSQSFRLEFAKASACYTFLVGDSRICENFLKTLRGFLKKMRREHYTTSLTISKANPQTLANIRLQVFGVKDENFIVKGQRLYEQIVNFTHPPLIKDRKIWFRTLPESMLGSEFTDWLTRHKEALNYREAVQIGQSLLDAGIIKCFDKDSRFLEEHRYYYFNLTQQSTDNNVHNTPEQSNSSEYDTKIKQYFLGKCCMSVHKKDCDNRLVPIAIIVTNTHITLTEENHQWPLPRYHEPPHSRSGPQFVFYAKQKITNITEMDIFAEHSCEVEIEFHDEDMPGNERDDRWRLVLETENSLDTFLEGIKEIWKEKFGVELPLNFVKKQD